MSLPEPDDIYGAMSGPANSFSEHEWARQLGITDDTLSMLDPNITSIVTSESRHGQAEAIALANTYTHDPRSYRNMANVTGVGSVVDPEGEEQAPVEMTGWYDQYTETPTATSDPTRPRTIAAAYDPQRHTLTIVFRDGTYYNYYEVTTNEWREFRGLGSKGEYIRTHLDFKPRGEAFMNDETISPDVRVAIYKVVRAGQVRRKGRTSYSVMKAQIAKPKAKSFPAGKQGKNTAWQGRGKRR